MNLGNLLIYTSILASFCAILFYLKSKSTNESDINFSRKLYYSTSVMIFVALMVLLFAFMNNEFKYSYVFSYSSSSLEWYYMISAVWAGQSGSFLLWVLMLNLCGLYVIRKKEKDESMIMAVIIATQLMILIILVVDSPFKYIWDVNPNFEPGQIPSDGSGLNPLLVDFWMIIHPPVLLLGYAAASIPFGYTIAGLITRDYTSWIERSYNWVLFSFTSLGIGIFLGCYWAYKVLGWGGYWGWDPVENSSLIPWLVGIILIHCMLIFKRKKALVKTNIFLSLTYLILVFISTYLTRSGVLSDFSVHSFGDSIVGLFLMFFIVLCFIVSNVLLLINYNNIDSKPLSENMWGWDSLLSYGMIALGVYTVLILVGTTMPIITGLFNPKGTAVTAEFYNNISVPFVLIIISLMVLSTMAILSKKIFSTKDIVILVASIALALFFNLNYTNKIVAYLFSIIAIFIVFQYIFDFSTIKSSSIFASRFSHIGLVIFIIGAISTGFHSTSIQKKIYLGKEDRVGNVDITFKGFTREKEQSIIFTVKEGNDIKQVSAKYFLSPQMNNSLYREPYIDYGFFGDTYIIPERFEPGVKSSAEGEIKEIAKGQEKVISGVRVKFIKLDGSKMAGDNPVIYANLLINGKRVSPGKKTSFQMRGKPNNTIDAKIPGTDRFVSLKGVLLQQELIELFVSPGAGEAAPSVPANVIINVSYKRLIWIVWLGTILVTIGGFFAIYRVKKTRTTA